MTDTIKYTNETEDQVVVMPEGWICVYPCKTWHNQLIQEWLDAGNIIEPYIKPTELIISELKQAIQQYLDSKAIELGYDNINSISKYMGFDNNYRLEAESLAAWTASVWKYVEAELVKMQEGTRTIPTVEEALLEIPQYGV